MTKYFFTVTVFLFLTLQALALTSVDNRFMPTVDDPPADLPAIKAKGVWNFEGQFQALIDHSYSKNWMGASHPHIGLATMNRMTLKYVKNKLAWENNLAVDLGFKCSFLPQKDPVTLKKIRFEKTVDVIDFNSKFGYQAKGYWFYSALFNWNTQMLKGYLHDTLLISAFMTKGTINLSLGMDYKRKMWSWFISPASAMFTFKTHPFFRDSLAYGVKPGQWCHPTIAAVTSIVFNADVHPKINLFTKLELKMDYFGEFTQLRNMDASFEMKWLFSITDWLAVSINAALLYDYDTKFDVLDATGKPTGTKIDHLQFRESIGVSLGYKFKIPKPE